MCVQFIQFAAHSHLVEEVSGSTALVATDG